jgi:hypothetical protein
MQRILGEKSGVHSRWQTWLLRLSYIPPYVLLRAVYGQKLDKSQGTRKVQVRSFYPADHTQRPAEKFWHDHNSLRAPCDYRFAVSPQGTCTKKERYLCDLLALVASLKWRVRGEKWHPNNYGTRTCVLLSTCVPRVKYVSREYNLSDFCLSSACAALACKRDSRGKYSLYSTFY